MDRIKLNHGSKHYPRGFRRVRIEYYKQNLLLMGIVQCEAACTCLGRDIVKIEYANNSCKCLRSSLEKLVDVNPAHKLQKRTRKRLVTAESCAIRMRLQQSDKISAVRKLEADIRNSIHHIFGCHSNCSIDFCKAVQVLAFHSQSTQLPIQARNHLPAVTDSSHPDISGIVFQDQAEMWTSGTNLSEQEVSRGKILMDILV